MTVVIAPVIVAQKADVSDLTQSFAINQENFASLGNNVEFDALRSQLIKIDIEDEIEALLPESYLEITVPVVGITDFIETNAYWHSTPQQFASIIALNGFGSNNSSDENNFSRPEYIVVKDIVGNEFEILLDSNGNVEIPDEGIGKFSVISSLTYMYGYNQVMGENLASISDVGAQVNTLYLLPPPLSTKPFSPTIKVTRYDENFQKIVESEREFPILIQKAINDTMPEFEVAASKTDFDNGMLLHFDFNANQNVSERTYNLHAQLDSIPGVIYSLDDPGQLETNYLGGGWSVDPLNSESFFKPVGLSKFSANALVRNLFSEFDFTKALLEGESFGLSKENNFNDFMINPDGVGSVYDYLLDGLVNNTIPGDFIFSHVPLDRISEMDLSFVNFDPHDAQVIEYLTQDLQQGDFTEFNSLFLSESKESLEGADQTLDVFASGKTLETIPEIQLEVMKEDNSVLDNSVLDNSVLDNSVLDNSIIQMSEGEHAIAFHESFLDNIGETFLGDSQNLSEGFIRIPNQSEHYVENYSVNFDLGSSHDATTLHFDDVLSIGLEGNQIKGFDMNNDKIDLGNLIDNFNGFSPEQVDTQVVGEDIKVQLTNSFTGEQIQVATLIGANSGDLPDDLGSIFTE